MIQGLKKRAAAAGGAKILFAYEASGQGFGLYDELTDAGIEHKEGFVGRVRDDLADYPLDLL